ncbi:MAG: hypothetical protein U0931_14505 [Vulcanimicrobiota bacterium]
MASGLLQTSLIYGLSFLYRATAPAYLCIMLSWFLGGAAGCWMPPRLSSRWLFLAACLTHALNTQVLLYQPGWGLALAAGFLGGCAGSHWLCRQIRKDLGNVLSYEMVGMMCGMAMVHSRIYSDGLGVIVAAPLVSLMLTFWRDLEAS